MNNDEFTESDADQKPASDRLLNDDPESAAPDAAAEQDDASSETEPAEVEYGNPANPAVTKRAPERFTKGRPSGERPRDDTFRQSTDADIGDYEALQRIEDRVIDVEHTKGPRHTRVKICGVTNYEDAIKAHELGAWAIGMIMWDQSPRYCQPQAAVEVVASLPRSVETVGVFVDAPLDHVARIAEDARLSMVQLHGNEGPTYCDEIERRTGCKVIKAFRVRDASITLEFAKYRNVDMHLADAYVPGVPGGTGESFDWSIVKEAQWTKPLLLSGGLNPGNVTEALTSVRPYGVDVASGVELKHGVKDHAKLAEFFAEVKEFDAAFAKN